MTSPDYNALRNLKFLVVPGHYGYMGGAERQAFHLIEWLRSKNLSVSVLGWTEPGPLTKAAEELGCRCFSYPYEPHINRLKKFATLYGLTKMLRSQIKPDIILPFVSIHSKPLCTIWRRTGAKYCWWNQQDEGRKLFGSEGEKRAILNASDITSNSIVGAEFISTTYNIPIDKIKVYNNGTPVPCLETLADSAQHEKSWRKNLNLAKHQKLAVMLANISDFKDHQTLLKAWKLVRDQFVSSGSSAPILALAGNLLDIRKVESLKSLAFDLKLCDCVHFLGSVTNTEQLLFESDLVVHSSIKEGCPNSVCEAMSVGKCVIATDISGCRQALGDANPDVFASPGNSDDLANKILRALQDDNFRRRAGEENRERIIKDFSISSMVDFFVESICSKVAYK
jgi:glycosyltransferase involved in cell wall biosynthesis